MLSTLGFILCAYGIYALARARSSRYRQRFIPYRQLQRKRRLTLVGGTGVGVGIIILISILGLPHQYENLSAASIISSSWGFDAASAGQAATRQEILPLKTQGDSGQPAYVYLHPETPANQLLAEKTASSWPKNKQRMSKPTRPGKSAKPVAQAAKKEKAPAKPQAKKKKPNTPPGNLAANPG